MYKAIVSELYRIYIKESQQSSYMKYFLMLFYKRAPFCFLNIVKTFQERFEEK